MMRDLREGIGTVLGSPWLWITITIAALGNIFTSGSIGIALPFLVKGKLHGDVHSLGWVYSAMAIGTALGTIWLGRYTKLRRRGLVAYGGWIISGLDDRRDGTVGFRAARGARSHGVCGATFAAFGLIWTNSLQELVPQNSWDGFPASIT